MKALDELWSTVSALNHLHTVDMKMFNGLATVNWPTFSYTVGAWSPSVKTVKEEVQKTQKAAAGKRVEALPQMTTLRTALSVPKDPLVTPKERVQMVTAEIWKIGGYRFRKPTYYRVKDHRKLKSRHRAHFWCSQDESHKKKSQSSQIVPEATRCSTRFLKTFQKPT
ncbi:hypothetical protein C8J57DRAFT_1235820 [Mycena rebaudengoi]|nr:hypothetical protein C8J57DRAFT_1235820 [Mycena rebaudengoi]